MFEGLIQSLTPHAQRLGSEADRRYRHAMRLLESINWNIERSREGGPDLDLYRRIQIPGVQAAGIELDRVPPGEAWVIAAVSARVPWEMQIGGMLLLSSTNTTVTEPITLLTGDVVKFVPTAPTDVSIVIRRSANRPDPMPDRTHGTDNLLNEGGVIRHEFRDPPRAVPSLPAARH